MIEPALARQKIADGAFGQGERDAEKPRLGLGGHDAGHHPGPRGIGDVRPVVVAQKVGQGRALGDEEARGVLGHGARHAALFVGGHLHEHQAGRANRRVEPGDDGVVARVVQVHGADDGDPVGPLAGLPGEPGAVGRGRDLGVERGAFLRAQRVHQPRPVTGGGRGGCGEAGGEGEEGGFQHGGLRSCLWSTR